MSLISSPYGFIPSSSLSGEARPQRIPLGITNSLVTNIFKYQPVKMNPSTGTLLGVTSASDKIFGFFAGVEYTPLGGRPAVSPFWAGGTTYDANFDMMVYYWPAWLDDVRVRVQADGPVPQTSLGGQFNITNATNGSTATGLSAATVGATVIGAGIQGQFTAIEFDPGVNSNPGDAFTDLICIVAAAQVGVGFTSIG